MRVVDSSAFLAILRGEEDAPIFAAAFETPEPLRMSAGTLLEVGIVVLHKREASRVSDMHELVALFEIEIIPVTVEHAHIAIQAYSRFGKGTGHPARLNYGDCFSYALAKSLDAPLLFKGHEFAHTDIRSAL